MTKATTNTQLRAALEKAARVGAICPDLADPMDPAMSQALAEIADSLIEPSTVEANANLGKLLCEVRHALTELEVPDDYQGIEPHLDEQGFVDPHEMVRAAIDVLETVALELSRVGSIRKGATLAESQAAAQQFKPLPRPEHDYANGTEGAGKYSPGYWRQKRGPAAIHDHLDETHAPNVPVVFNSQPETNAEQFHRYSYEDSRRAAVPKSQAEQANRQAWAWTNLVSLHPRYQAMAADQYHRDAWMRLQRLKDEALGIDWRKRLDQPRTQLGLAFEDWAHGILNAGTNDGDES